MYISIFHKELCIQIANSLILFLQITCIQLQTAYVRQTCLYVLNPVGNALLLADIVKLLAVIHPNLACNRFYLNVIHLLPASNRFTLACINKLLAVVYPHSPAFILPLPMFVCNQPAFVLHMSQTTNSVATPIYLSQAL